MKIVCLKSVPQNFLFQVIDRVEACDGQIQQILNVDGERSSLIVMIENEKAFYQRYQNFDKNIKIVFCHGSNEY